MSIVVAFIRSNKLAPLSVKVKVLKACVITSLLYNCETFSYMIVKDQESQYYKLIKCTLRQSTPNLLVLIESGLRQSTPNLLGIRITIRITSKNGNHTFPTIQVLFDVFLRACHITLL